MRKARRVSMAIFGMVCVGVASAATLKDNPPSIFYPADHFLADLPRTVGADLFGYNYQAHVFNGFFANAYLGGDGYPPYWGDTEAYYQMLVEIDLAASVEDAEIMLSDMWYWENRDERLVIKWNDAWLSNQDRGDDALGTTPDGNLDRHYGYPAYADSGAWLTNQRSGTDEVVINGKVRTQRWTYFIKIITPPSSAVKEDGIWYTEDGIEIGPERYNSFAAVQIISNDKLYDEHGLLYRSSNGSGFGVYGPE